MTIFKLSIRGFVVPLTLAAFALCSCTSTPRFINRVNACVFDDWPSEQDPRGVDRPFGVWPSPDGTVSITYLKADEDEDVFILKGQGLPDGEGTVLGYGLYSVDVKWFSTRAGDIAVVDHGISNGMNELFVLRPRVVKGAVSWECLFRTPEIGHTADHLAVAHCYWKLKSVDSNMGVMRLQAAWDFANLAAVAGKVIASGGTFDVPLFYGWQ